MAAFVYGYNVNGYTTFQATKALTSKQTNVYEYARRICICLCKRPCLISMVSKNFHEE